MFTKLNQVDLIEFFESEPVSIADDDVGVYIYSIRDLVFCMVISINIYAMDIDIAISYSNNTVFSGRFDGVTEIRKSDDLLIADLESGRRLIIKKYPCFGVIIEEIGD